MPTIAGILGVMLVFLAAVGAQTLGAEPPRPNILIILADDLGWADVGFHGGDIKTPQIDRLAATGVRLEQFYVQPVCSPTRAAMMTGRYPMRLGLQVGVVRPWAQYGLPLEERTLAQALHDVGYETGICGKWHLGHCQPGYLPTYRGFDHQYGHYNGAIDYFTHERDGGHDWHRDDKACYDQGYSTFLLADEAVKRIRDRDRSKPLFLYLPFNAVHAPHQVPPEYTAPYANLPEPRRTYAGMVAAMDEAIGRVVAELDAQSMRSNTLIFFCSDNGGPQPGKVTSNGLFRAGKGTLYEGGVRVCALATWQGHLRPGTEVREPLHVVDLYPTLLRLAGASLSQKLPLDGRDAWATIADAKPSPHETILLNAAPLSGAILAGQWKLVIRGDIAISESQVLGDQAQKQSRRRNQAPVELFFLAADPYEKANLASKHPDKVSQIRASYDAIARQAVPPRNQRKAPDFRSPAVWGEQPSQPTP